MATTTNRGPSLGALSRIGDPNLAQQLQQILSRLAKLEEDLGGLSMSALGNRGAVNLRDFPIQHLRDPKFAQDAVNLRTLLRYVENRLRVAADDGDTGGGDGDGGSGGGAPGGATPTVPLPNMLNDVRAYAAAHPADLANSCMPPTGSGTNAYIVGLVAYLQGIDPRVNFNGKRGDTGDPSDDAISYYHGVLPPVEGSKDVYVIDVIGCHCGPELGFACAPGPDWNNVSRFGPGAWISTPPT